MIKPEPQVIKALALFVRQHPEFLEWLDGWRLRELDQLPTAINNTAVFQGRCQVLCRIFCRKPYLILGKQTLIPC